MVSNSNVTISYKNLELSFVFDKLNDILFKKLMLTLRAVCGTVTNVTSLEECSEVSSSDKKQNVISSEALMCYLQKKAQMFHLQKKAQMFHLRSTKLLHTLAEF